ncbi:MAG: Triosephosphate isomerase [Parcubacteria group bacterium GW2011_GWC2_39_14]|nr:MAG: Triosephosphate isomerase [Parcubacteria group bacterium GW2011_GWC2_39_14]KKR55560.1 MAG: Triosephosphate isomerase [Parcubacteria group bacterium GW2011_GWA2_40_23]
MKKILIANWKMNLDVEKTLQLARDYKKELKALSGIELIVAPSLPLLIPVEGIFAKTKIGLAGQNVAAFSTGSYTGEVSAAMLKQIGCKYSLVGHSERRQHVAEIDEMIHKKIVQCYAGGLIPVLCVGELLKDKENGQRDSVIINQLHQALAKVPDLPEKEIIIAYEPAWALGTGVSVEKEDLLHVERIIKRAISSLFSESFYNEKVRLLYGGSVNSKNVSNYWGIEKMSGFLVATASLDAEEFSKIALSMK